jgi:hypothetical protein
MIKLFEQWLAEEDLATAPKQEEPTTAAKPGSYTLNITADGKSFEVEGTSDSEFTTKEMISFNVSKSTNPSIKSGAIIAISPKADKDGDFDIVAVNDQNKPEDALIYSGKVEKSKS